MNFNGLCLISLLLVCSLKSVSAGAHICLDLKPVPDFDMNQFIGTWYVVETSLRLSQCLVHEFSRYKREPKPTGVPRDNTEPIVYKNHYYGELIADPELPSSMSTHAVLPDDSSFKASFVVFATDYVNFAGVYSCQESTVGLEHTVSIFSRTPVLEEIPYEMIEKVKDIVRLTDFPMELLKQVNHENCKHPFTQFDAKKLYSNVNFQSDAPIHPDNLPKWML